MPFKFFANVLDVPQACTISVAKGEFVGRLRTELNFCGFNLTHDATPVKYAKATGNSELNLIILFEDDTYLTFHFRLSESDKKREFVYYGGAHQSPSFERLLDIGFGKAIPKDSNKVHYMNSIFRTFAPVSLYTYLLTLLEDCEQVPFVDIFPANIEEEKK